MLAAVGALLLCVSMKVSVGADPLESDERRPENKGVDLRSHGRQTADEVRWRQATEDVVLRQGPVVPGVTKGEVASGQTDVDALLSGLGM